MAMSIVLPQKRWRLSWPSRILRWPVFVVWKWTKWELRFPVPLLGLHQLVGQFWTSEDGPLYSVSLSRVILFGDSLLCLAMSLANLADQWWLAEGVPNKSRRWLAEGVLGLMLLPIPRRHRRRAFIHVVRRLLTIRARRPVIGFAAMHAAELALALAIGCYVLIIRAAPSPSLTLHHYEWVYDALHVCLFAVVGRSLLLCLVQYIGTRSKGRLSRRQQVLFVGILLCVVGYLVVVWWGPDAWRFSGIRIHSSLFGDAPERLFTWQPMPHGSQWP